MIRGAWLVALAGWLLLLPGCEEPVSDLRPTYLRCEFLEEPKGIDALQPRLSWELEASGRGRKQTAYRILVATDMMNLVEHNGNLWDSGKILSDETVNIRYQGRPLSSRASYWWTVQVWDEDSVAGKWSEPSMWSMGLLDQEDWTAQWIGYDKAVGDTINYPVRPWANGMVSTYKYQPTPCSYLRKEFDLADVPTSGTAYVTALGDYSLYINGKRVSEDYFAPGWTDYDQRICYRTYEVQELLQSGRNTVAVVLAAGWYAGNISNRGDRWYGDRTRFILQLETELPNDPPVTIQTDGSWKASFGPLREADMQAGETYDARLEMPGWDQSGFDDKAWEPVAVSDSQTAPLRAYPGLPVQKINELKPVAIFESEPGVYMVDMGQNFAGWARLNVQGERGQKVVMRFGEKLNPDSTLHTRNLRTAHCTDTYILKGGGPETYEPLFTYHGYQFIEVTGYPGTLTTDNITGVVLHTNLPESGSFSCSNELINQIQSNIVWSQKSNYFDVPTDCPQRDERMGWLGDAQVFMRTAAYNMDIQPFFTKWMMDVVEAQREGGRFASTAPRVFNRVAAGWGDASVICPWTQFQLYNDTQMVEYCYPALTGWMDFLKTKLDKGIGTLNSYGDWQNVDSETPIPVLATAYHKRCCDLMANMADLTGRDQEAVNYRALSATLAQAFTDSLVDDSGYVEGRTQTGYLMVLAFDLVPDSLRPTVADHLLANLADKDNHLSTGILGTNLLLPVLTDLGHLDLAYQLLLNTDYPSWGHHIENGATTIWERWDSYSHTDGFHEDSTNSLNHYAYGSVGEWFYSTIAGISSQDPGYKNIIIRPHPGGGLTEASASYRSVRGRIESSWKIEDGRFKLDVTIPVNTQATVFLPGLSLDSVREGGLPLKEVEGVVSFKAKGLGVELAIGSGAYAFEVTLVP